MGVIKKVLKGVVYCFCCLLPKLPVAVVYGVPDYEGSVLSMERELARTQLSRIIILVQGDPSSCPFSFGAKTKVVRKTSVRGFVWFMVARYVFFTDRCYLSRFPAKVESVNIWHGMPLKRIGWMLQGNRGIASKYALATSALWAEVIHRSMRPFESTLVTGLPRNDLMLNPLDSVACRLQHAGLGADLRIVAWLPTYRNSVRGEIRQDGRESGSVLGVFGLPLEQLNSVLSDNEAIGFVKVHPMARFEGCVELSNLLVVNDEWLARHAISLYEILGQSALLVSDISSVVVDYLVMDRPVIHVFPDVQEYSQSRGFSLEPIEDYFVGPVVVTAEELITELMHALEGEDAHAMSRRRVRQLFHEHTDAGASRRLREYLQLKDWQA